jgi:hypothetical protein
VVQLAPELYYKVISLEPMYYGLVGAAVVTAIVPVPNLIPARNFIHYVTGWGIDGPITVQVRYQSGAPRNTVGALSTQRLDRFQASYLAPFTSKFAVVAGDTLEVDIATVVAGATVAATVWFYGWKMNIRNIERSQPGDNIVQLTDVREFR